MRSLAALVVAMGLVALMSSRAAAGAATRWRPIQGWMGERAAAKQQRCWRLMDMPPGTVADHPGWARQCTTYPCDHTCVLPCVHLLAADAAAPARW